MSADGGKATGGKQAIAVARSGLAFVVLASIALAVSLAHAQGRPDPEALIAKQRAAMAPLHFMDGVWRGPAWTLRPDGSKHEITQTERIGPFLGGAVKVVEGRGYEDDGRVSFNAFGTIAFDPQAGTYSIHSYAMGFAGDFPFTPKSDGYVWETPGGPGAIIRYTATVIGQTYDEVGDRIAGSTPPLRIFEMHLKRVGDTDWPAAGAVPIR